MPENLPAVPLTVEGAWALHQMFRIRRAAWRALDEKKQHMLAKEATERLSAMPQSALFSQIGHKGDLMLIHFRNTLSEVHRAELALAELEFFDYLEPVHSYVSVVELGLYESSAKTYLQLAERGLEAHSAEWTAAVEEVVQRQQNAMAARLYPEIPPAKFLCFYPMDRKRAEEKNFYTIPLTERQRMMHDHGMIGRRYAGTVKQIITGSIGFDDWEWGVDLFADDPLIFKKLIYEMRFDEVSAVYALFGSFYIGERVAMDQLAGLMQARLT